ncbi:general secretion pathway protein GspB [Salinimonas lutimaris]|uniref:general secretion pathway protein GspB n=1 Tax=Salinimonas lutimaris TaxID=914153 RepID=UPI0010BF8118|nr:general secretion pathway protein GspB [Salinimonas lutimaris]
MSERISIDALVPGMVIVQVTRQNGPVKIRKSGLVSSTAMVQGLAEMGVQEVEIDPEQTVELEPQVQHRTQTQQLLRGAHDKTAGLDTQLSEQFNRSLFLPTVQGLPSAGKMFVRSVTAYLVIALAGAGIGFAAGTAGNWWPGLWSSGAGSSAQTAAPAEDKTERQPKPSVPDSKKPVEAANISPAPQSPTPPASEAPAADNALPASNTPSDANDSSPSDVEGRAPEPASNTAKANTAGSQSTAAQPADEYEGKVLNAPQQAADGQVPQALLERFNQALEELDNQTPAERRQAQPKVSVSNDIQRIDQLPVRLLTRLPTMKFSAHMYASSPSERWVRVNGKQLTEGDWIDDKVRIINIEGQRVVLEFEDETFYMRALTDW